MALTTRLEQALEFGDAGCRSPAVFRTRVLTSLPSESMWLRRASHKHYFRAPVSRAFPFFLSTYAPRAGDSNRYYRINNLTRYQKWGIILRELWLPARYCFPFWNSPLPSTHVLLLCSFFFSQPSNLPTFNQPLR